MVLAMEISFTALLHKNICQILEQHTKRISGVFFTKQVALSPSTRLKRRFKVIVQKASSLLILPEDICPA